MLTRYLAKNVLLFKAHSSKISSLICTCKNTALGSKYDIDERNNSRLNNSKVFMLGLISEILFK